MLPLENAVMDRTRYENRFASFTSVDYSGILTSDSSIRIVYHGGKQTRHEIAFAMPADREIPPGITQLYPTVAYSPSNGGSRVSEILWYADLRELPKILRRLKMYNPLTLMKLSIAITRINSELRKNMRR